MQRVSDAEHMYEEARTLIARLIPRKHATVVTLSGELGAGKTTLAKGVAKALGVQEHITSPTFVIMKVYPIGKPAVSDVASNLFFKRLVHIDAYRLKGIHHLKVLGWDELLTDPENLILVEWPEKIADAIPKDAVRLTLRYSGEGERDLVYDGEKDPREE